MYLQLDVKVFALPSANPKLRVPPIPVRAVLVQPLHPHCLPHLHMQHAPVHPAERMSHKPHHTTDKWSAQGTHIEPLAVGGRPHVGVVAEVAAEALGVEVFRDEVAPGPVQRPALRQRLGWVAPQRPCLQLPMSTPE